MLRGVLSLSFGTAAARGLAAIGQLLLAVWLSPADFGYWAATTSVISVLTGLANFGEVNGYLSGQGRNFRGTRRAILGVNGILAGSGTLIAALYLMNGNSTVALLAFISALSIPIVGDAELMYSTGVKYKVYRPVVVAQISAAGAKIVIGIVVALVQPSALAFAVSTASFYVVMDLLILPRLRSSVLQEDTVRPTVELRTRLKWGLNSLFMTLPIQIGFIVAQFGATPEMLGLYFFAYQISLGLSGLVSVPLSRVTLSTLAGTGAEERINLSLQLCQLFVLCISGLAAAVSLVIPLLAGMLGGEWSTAAGPTVVLLASLAVRMMTPILDGLQQAQDKWWQGTAFNVVDTVGTASAALLSLTGDLLLLVVAVAGWKVGFGLLRAALLLRPARKAPLALTLLAAASAAVLIAGSQFVTPFWGLMALAAAFVGSAVGATLLLWVRRTQR